VTGFVLLLALGVAAAFFVVLRRLAFVEQELRRVESEIARLESRIGQAAPPERRAEPRPAAVALAERARTLAAEPRERAPTAAEPPPPHEPAPEPAPERALPDAPGLSLETLIGSRLPIWIGGAALVLAGFFLVRYSIESGLLGPATRTVLAALFGIALVAASEAARRFPATADDPRVAQALSGAGIASLYGTLYMAAALYHLISPLTAFVLVVVVTGIAMALALRHGPPTAVMALVGGFAAPLVAGFDAAGIGPLLVYLAIFIAALFGLAIRRGWGWLALAAAVAGFAWINFLIAALAGREQDLSAVGAFTMLLAAGASAAIPAAGARNPWLRLAPLVAGFVQLVALAPALDFGPLAWSFYLVLAAAALFLSWRDSLYLPAALAALAFLLVLQGLALLQPERSATPVAAVLATLLFAIPGHLLATRATRWALIALGGSAGPLLVAHLCAPSLLPDLGWGALELLAAAACARTAWLLRGPENSVALTSATLATALLAALGLAQFVPDSWLAIPLTLVLFGLAAWARTARAPQLYELPVLPFLAALLAAALPIIALLELVFASATGDRLPYLRLPELGELLRTLVLPVAALLALLLDSRQLGRVRRAAGTAAITLGILLLYALAKQLLVIGTLPRFAALGFVERALLTQACLAAGWLLLRRGRFPSLAGVLLTLGLCRLVWFDLVVLNPVIEPQQVGGIPLLNAAALHLGLAAFWLWTVAPTRATRAGAAALTIVALLAAVRQATHGSFLTGPIGTLENTGYSAVLLGLALFWLWRGISAGERDLRLYGLALLTLVTFKVFLIDAAALEGVLRILSFLALGVALIGIGWAYNRFLGRGVGELPAATA
jgi:uncharacterized membrane protein